MIYSYEISAFLDENGKVRPFYLRISGPVQDIEGGDYFCSVHAPALFSEDKKIYGADEKQAQDLALQFVKQMLGNKRLIDKDGNLIDLPNKQDI